MAETSQREAPGQGSRRADMPRRRRSYRRAKGLGGALGVDRVVFLVQPFIGGFARVDRTAHAALQDFAHRPPLFLVVGLVLALDGGLRPKNSGPDQRIPVISRAIIERLGYIRPWKSYWPSAVAIMGSERARDGAVPEEAIRRAASLEDVFVKLTGAEAE